MTPVRSLLVHTPVVTLSLPLFRTITTLFLSHKYTILSHNKGVTPKQKPSSHVNLRSIRNSAYQGFTCLLFFPVSSFSASRKRRPTMVRFPVPFHLRGWLRGLINSIANHSFHQSSPCWIMTHTQQGAAVGGGGGEQHALTRTDKHRYTAVPDSHTLAHMLTTGIQEGHTRITVTLSSFNLPQL